MPVIGFLLPLLLTIAGGLLGAFLSGGAAGAVWWGVGGGFVLGCIGMAVLLWGWRVDHAERRLRYARVKPIGRAALPD